MAATFPGVCAVVPAAGFGRRMQTECPKQYLSIGNKTILEHAVAALLTNACVQRVVIAVSPGDVRFSQLPLASTRRLPSLTAAANAPTPFLLACRRCPMRSGCWCMTPRARACIRTISPACWRYAKPAALAASWRAPVRDTMKRAEPGKVAIAHTVDRNDLWHALTPQFFPRELLFNCLTRALNEGATITDEASALEYCGFHPELVVGRADNIKVTRPEDLALAEFYLTRSRHQEKA
ncbi:2-C-methyl-D-erythritol 4-phosphate cytidylyltransferase [Raoultella terrigena]|uniref:2-C-methyl-D-erythritol 4-phosphate cytidylyltransferase n=1 Tax=Raoultella terrigena TaxID=577 RepID=A0A485CCG6_RAOTE|nr:2-C-methyl-D-erythritol 4-phosphate cytidylyltransferase [Raoultella terrigena]